MLKQKIGRYTLLKSQILIKMKLKKELFNYVLFGALTTIINIVIYLFLTDIAHVHYIISNIISWALSVIFAYVTNRIWVFESKNNNILKELFLFYGGRLFSVILETMLMILFIDILSFGNLFSKIVVTIIIIIINYLISKVIVFK